MKLTTNTTSFNLFLDLISKTLHKNFDLTNYFQLSEDKKNSLNTNILKLLKNLINNKIPVNDSDFNELIVLLIKNNESNENYELSGVLKNILETKNFKNDEKVVKTKKLTIKVKRNEEENNH
jgi:hypothetical protein